ncbi:hypothetical protein D3C85_1103940 [compost metagenome]
MRVTIELQNTNLDQRKLFLRPGLGDVERILVMSGSLGFSHDLNAHSPFRKITAFNGIEQIALGVIRVSAGQARSIRWSQVLDPLLGFVMPFHPMTLATGANQAIGVATEAVHVAVTIRDASVRKQDCDLVQRLRRVRPEVPHRLRTFEVALRQTLLGVDKVREFERITDEEHRRVVADDVPVAFFGVELQRKTTWITLGISRTALATDRGEPEKCWCLLADGVEQLRAGVLSDITSYGERAVSTRTLGVHTTLRDVFTVEVGKLLDQVKVVEQQRATRAGGTGILVIGDRSATGGGKRFILAHAISSFVSLKLPANRLKGSIDDPDDTF